MDNLLRRPDAYNQYEGFNVLDVCSELRAKDGGGNFNRGSAFKYLARAGWKSPETEVADLELAMYYIQKEILRVRKDPGTQKAEEPPIRYYCQGCTKELVWIDGSNPNTRKCLNGCGWLYLPDADGNLGGWFPHYTTKRQHLCPRCNTELHKKEGDDIRHYCPNNHGEFMFPKEDPPPSKSLLLPQ